MNSELKNNEISKSSGLEGFTMVGNNIVLEKGLSLKDKGLYGMIHSYISYDDLALTKTFLADHCADGEKSFNSSWNELKEKGYLKIHQYVVSDGKFRYVYKLLDTADALNGVYLFRYDKNGKLSSTNKGRGRLPLPPSDEILKKVGGFTIVGNNVLRDRYLSLKAKGLYILICAYISYDGFILTKAFLRRLCTDGERSFDQAWNELKKMGYLKVHRHTTADGKFRYTYELGMGNREEIVADEIEEAASEKNGLPLLFGASDRDKGGSKIIMYNHTDNVYKAFKSRIDYEGLKKDETIDQDILNMTVRTAADMFAMKDEMTWRINGVDRNRQELEAQLSKLDGDSMRYLIHSITGSKKPIRHMQSFLRTSLYNAPDDYLLFLKKSKNAEDAKLFSGAATAQEVDQKRCVPDHTPKKGGVVDKNEPYPHFRSSGKGGSNIILYNNTKNIYSLSITHNNIYKAFREQIDYERLKKDETIDQDILNMTVRTAADMLEMKDGVTWKINGVDHNRQEIGAQLSKLDGDSMRYLILSIAGSKKPIRHMQSFLRTSLYNAPDDYLLFLKKSQHAENKAAIPGDMMRTKKAASRFHNFNQRTYDYGAMEIEFVRKLQDDKG